MLSITSLALLAGVASASPTAFDQLAKQGRFSLQQTAVEAPQLSLPEAIRRDYVRHGAMPPEELEVAVRTHSRWAAELLDSHNQTADAAGEAGEGKSTTVAARPGRHDIQYLMSIKIGKHDMIVDLDTGSSDLWVVSDLLAPAGRGGRSVAKLYDTKASTGTKMAGYSWRITYGDRSTAQGAVYQDAVTIGSLTVKKQAVEVAQTVSAQFTKDTSRDGLLGLGFGKGNQIRPTPQPTWFENVREQLKEPVFTCALKRREVGSYDFGFVDPNKYKGPFIWHPVRGYKSHWDFNVTSVSVGGQTINRNILAIADTGSSLWYMPDEITDAYWKKVPGAQFAQMGGGWTFPCGQKLPDITVTVSGKRIVVPGINLDYSNIGGRCMGGLQRDLKGIGFSLFGDTFLKGLYVVHEAPKGKQPRIGFAIAKGGKGSLSGGAGAPSKGTGSSGPAKGSGESMGASPAPKPKPKEAEAEADEEAPKPKAASGAKGTGASKTPAPKPKPKDAEAEADEEAPKPKAAGGAKGTGKSAGSSTPKAAPKEAAAEEETEAPTPKATGGSKGTGKGKEEEAEMEEAPTAPKEASGTAKNGKAAKELAPIEAARKAKEPGQEVEVEGEAAAAPREDKCTGIRRFLCTLGMGSS